MRWDNGGVPAKVAVFLPILAFAGCGGPPTPYYASRPVVVAPSEPTTQYVYGTVHSTNTTHITSESTVHIITNHPDDAPPQMSQTTTESRTVEPAPPEEQQVRDEPDVEPAAEPAVEQAEPAEPEAPPPEAPAPDSDGSDK